VDRGKLTATDTSWSAGQGPQVQGTMSALFLVCAGRVAALPQLTGPGAAALTARLSAPVPAKTPAAPASGRNPAGPEYGDHSRSSSDRAQQRIHDS
jgi:hypothetical protein